MPEIRNLFTDEKTVCMIQRKLPYLFKIAEMDSARAGKIGMEVGSEREKIIVALLMYKFGKENVDYNIRVTEPEVDVRVYGEPISIKTVSGRKPSPFKLAWTVDATKARDFLNAYKPKCGIILVHVNWGAEGSFCYIPLEVQRRAFTEMGRERYIKLPKEGTNPRGVEITAKALGELVKDKSTLRIPIRWHVDEIKYDPIKRWLDYWEREDC